MYSTENSTQYSAMTYMGRRIQNRVDICITEANTALEINYTPIQIIFLRETKKQYQNQAKKERKKKKFPQIELSRGHTSCSFHCFSLSHGNIQLEELGWGAQWTVSLEM